MKRPFSTIGHKPSGVLEQRLTRLLFVAVPLAIISLIIEYGFTSNESQLPLPQYTLISVQLVAVFLFVIRHIVRILASAHPLQAIRQYGFDSILIGAGLLFLISGHELVESHLLKASAFYVITLQVLLGVRFAVGAFELNLVASQRKIHPVRLVVLGFAIMILLGGLALCLPMAVSPGLRNQEGWHYLTHVLNCFFTSTSATCVTGLTVYDTGSDFTRFGQIVILCLIQIGGLGIMVFSALFGMLAGRQFSLKDSLVIQDTVSYETIGKVSRMVRFIILTTVLCEITGAILLYPVWPESMTSIPERIYYSIFHAVSAFCNAGFSLDSNSLIPYRNSWGIYISIMPLIILGGLGFPVLSDLARIIRSRFSPPPRDPQRQAVGIPRVKRTYIQHRLSLHTKLVLITTVFLIVIPAFLLFLTESSDWRLPSQKSESSSMMKPICDMPQGERAMACLFQSVTARTAGFNTASLDTNSLSPAGMFLTSVLMIIGGSPASTAGGIKTIAFCLLMLSVFSTLRGRQNVEVFGRTIPFRMIRRSNVMVVVLAMCVCVVTATLCFTESGTSLSESLFETTSAFGTVGLTTGLTARLSVTGKIIIILCMYAGRIGPLSLLVALAGREESPRYDYPEEEVIIG